MTAALAAEPAPGRAETALELCRGTSAERLNRLRSRGAADGIVRQLNGIYDEFLTTVQRDDATLLLDFGDEQLRRKAVQQAAQYGDLIYELLRVVTDLPGCDTTHCCADCLSPPW